MSGIERIEQTYMLSGKAIDEISEQIGDLLSTLKLSPKDIVRYRLSVEECLLQWLDGEPGTDSGESPQVTLRTGTRLRTPFIEIDCEGHRSDPFSSSDSESFGSYGQQLLVRLGLSPEYRFICDDDGLTGINRIHFKVKKPSLSQLAQLAIVLLAALLVGITGMVFLPDGLRTTLNEGFVTAVCDTFFHVIGLIAGPMILLSVIWGIYGIGDAETFGRIGKRMMLTFVTMVFIASALALLWTPVIGPALSDTSAGKSQFAQIVEMILNIIPSNIVEPFAEGNTLQIIFIAVCIGLTLLFLGKQISVIATVVEQLNSMIQFMMSAVCRFVPVFIFFIVVNLIWSGAYKQFSDLWLFVLLSIISFYLLVMIYTLYTSLRRHVRPSVLVRKMLPAHMIAVTTASSAATFEMNRQTCVNEYGIDSSTTGFGLPLGMVIQKMTSAFYLVITALFFSKSAISVSWLIMAVIVCSTLAIAMPPVPGGAAATYLIVFTQLGLPQDALSIVIAIDLFADFFLTATDMCCLQLSMINIASKLGLIDRNKLTDGGKS